ncbi:uncharacterized protein FFB20_07937 [Fusarium fujikuroi]|nr:Uncharacterized protein LW94_3630 [Fusarium fujikuroi]SCN87384.1 uncharacterized protein FFB20_07937 [Fusarium fujikuroi]VZH91494.1 unnamed protein product [Fusarium fujikuroi]
MSDSVAKSQQSPQTVDDNIDSPNAPSVPDLEAPDSGIEDDALFQENEEREGGETLPHITIQDDVTFSVVLPPDGTVRANTTNSDGIANPATSLSLEASIKNLSRSLESINGLLRGVLEMVITQNLQTGMTMHEILKMPLHDMPDAVLDTRAKIRVKLGNANFGKLQKDSERDLAIQRLRDAGPPWNMVTDLRAVGNSTLLLTVVNDVWDDKIRLEAGKLGSIIGLDPDWSFTPKRYSLEILDYYCGNKENSRSLKQTWSMWNEVEIADAFVSSNKLILSLESREDAEKLWKGNGVILGSSHFLYKAKPIDLRSIDKWCPTFESYRCVNCPEKHSSTSRNCKNSDVVKMLKECEMWRKVGPSWARAVQQPQLPDEALMSRLRAYRNTPVGRTFLNGYMSAPEPRQFVSDQGSANAGATTTTQPATQPTTNARKRKVDWDSRELRNEPPTLMQFSQMNQRKLDQANKANRGSRPVGRGRPRGGSSRANLSKRRRGN